MGIAIPENSGEVDMYSRTNPFTARLKSRVCLSKPGSSKATYHIELDIMGSQLAFRPGDSIGVYPTNDPAVVAAILQTLRLDPDEPIFDPRSQTTLSISAYLATKANLAKSTSTFLKLMRDRGAQGLDSLLDPENKARLNECLQSCHLIDCLQLFPHARLSAQDLSSLLPLMPRFYSIASSPHVFPEEIHLTVANLIYCVQGHVRHGVGSHFLCEMAQPYKTSIPIYVQPSNGFSLPPPEASMILIGPGTGVAPFRAFLQERLALQHPGRNWLFFGERNRATDFYYQDFFLDLERQNRLRLDLAFSRDQEEKVYVQHRLWEQRSSVYDWLQQGAFLYVCGDAEKMAKDVDLTLHRIARDQGSFTEEQARGWLKELRQAKRYLQDVY